MGQINIVINGRGYELACGDGQEAHLRELAKHVNERVVDLRKSNQSVDETRLLVMMSLLIADELQVEKAAHAETKNKLKNAKDIVVKAGEPGTPNIEHTTNYIADVFDDISDRLERVAQRIEIVEPR